jgi:hypothetical protein
MSDARGIKRAGAAIADDRFQGSSTCSAYVPPCESRLAPNSFSFDLPPHFSGQMNDKVGNVAKAHPKV